MSKEFRKIPSTPVTQLAGPASKASIDSIDGNGAIQSVYKAIDQTVVWPAGSPAPVEGGPAPLAIQPQGGNVEMFQSTTNAELTVWGKANVVGDLNIRGTAKVGVNLTVVQGLIVGNVNVMQEIQDLKDQIENCNDTISGLHTEVLSLQSQIASLQSQIAAGKI